MRTHSATPAKPIPPKPIGIYPYFDVIQFWVRKPLDQKQIRWLREHCASLFIGNRPARFNRRLRQRIVLRRPDEKAVQWLADYADALINRAEAAVDLVYKYRADRDEAWEFLHRHLIRPWHGARQEIRIHPGEVGTRYDAGRSAPNIIVFYRQDHARITGEVNCLHLEWRLNRLRALHGAQIRSGQDLPNFDHRAFWQKRLRLYTVNRRRLGRLYRKRFTGERGRAPESLRSSRYVYDIEGKTGEVLTRAFETVQELVDNFKSSFRIQRALLPIPNASLLAE